MPDRPPICPSHFIRTMTPLLERQDVRGAVCAIQKNWSMAQVIRLLDAPDEARRAQVVPNTQDVQDAQKVAAVALGLVGDEACLEALARQLRHPDRVVGQMAEHAMWSIWFRSGNCGAQKHFARGSVAFSQRQYDRAADEFTHAIAADAGFAEAFNQRAIVHYVEERFPESLADCERAIELMPLHFGAWAGAGHCHACLGERDEAIRCYRRAKQINPHLECVDALIDELKEL